MKENAAQVAKRLAKARGYSYPEWEYLAEKDPVFLDAYNRLSGLSLLHEGFPTKGKQLPAKYRELVAIAAMIGQSRMWGVKPHMERAQSSRVFTINQEAGGAAAGAGTSFRGCHRTPGAAPLNC